jgi:hypothetical protein
MDGQTLAAALAIMKGMPDNAASSAAAAAASAEAAQEYAEDAAASAAAMHPENYVAQAFSASLAYSAGTYVMHDGHLYRLTADHDADVTWENTAKVQVKVADDVGDLKSAFDFFENSLNFTPIQVNINKSIDIHPANPTIKPSSIKTETGWCCVCVPCAEGDVFHVTGKGGYTTRLWGFADSNGALIDGYESESGAVGNYTVVIAPADAAYFAYNSKTDVTYGVCKGYDPNKTIQIVDEEHDAAEEKLSAENKQLNTALGLFGAVEFTVESGATHSSTKDKAYCDIKSGETFYVSISKSGSTNITCSLYGWKNNGTSEIIQNSYTVNGNRTQITASSNYVAISCYMNPISATQSYILTVENTNSFFKKTNEEIAGLDAKVEENTDKIDNLVDIIGVYGETAFTVESGSSHSSTADNIKVSISSGDIFYVTVAKSESTAVSGSIFVHKSDGNVNLGTIAIDGKRHAFTAPADITWVGLYLNPLAYTQTYNMRVEKEDNIYIDIDNAGSAVEDEIKRRNIFKNSSKNFIFFTDIHGSLNNMSKIVAYANKYHANIDFIINGGDTVSQYLDDGIAWYDTAVSGCNVDVLTAVGNHDVWDDALYDKLPATTVYSNFIAPVAMNVSDLVQPEDAATDGKCYYYKDYGSVRVIILNAMSGDDSVTYWDANAKTWLEAVLADAKTNSKHVLCVNHTPFTATDRVLNTDSQWTSFKPYFDGMVLEPDAVSAVQSFITSGGIFIGWLVGHSHTDEIMKNNNGQFMFASATAHYANDYFHSDGYGSNNVDDETYNCFNLCGIDTTNKIFKMVRIGWNMDSSMRKRNSFSYDYQNKKILSDRG